MIEATASSCLALVSVVRGSIGLLAQTPSPTPVQRQPHAARFSCFSIQIRSVKQQLCVQLKMPRHDSAPMHIPKPKKRQVTFGASIRAWSRVGIRCTDSVFRGVKLADSRGSLGMVGGMRLMVPPGFGRETNSGLVYVGIYGWTVSPLREYYGLYSTSMISR
jgi:hypothetical protein